MRAYIGRRLLLVIPTMLVVAIFTFGLLQITPGDPAALLAGEEETAEDIEKIRKRLGLDKPVSEQFVTWIGKLARGDLGTSIRSGKPVTGIIIGRLEPTIALTILTEIVAISVAIPLGVLAAWKANTWIDRVVMSFSVLGFSIPVFWLGFLLIWVFALTFHLLPAGGYQPIFEGFWPFAKRMILPTVSAALVIMALVARITRASVIEVLQEDYVRTARAKGLGERLVLWRHTLKNASLPIVTIIGLGFAALLTGVVVVEVVFAVPGLGRLLSDAIKARDYPIIQGLIIVLSAIYILVNLAVDVIYAYLDPRIRY